ncbi:MAG: hypothetical protein ACI9LM_000369 [Alteromonadaceae bacterium]|jgi:hypothetical protein
MNFLKMSEKEILDIATPIMDNLMQASTDIDHFRHVQDFTDRAKAIVTKEHLEWVCKKYQSEKGIWGKREPIAVLKRPDSAVIIWKQTCSKVEGDYVAEIVLTHINGRFLVDHAMVF